jgi:hypothetical protein
MFVPTAPKGDGVAFLMMLIAGVNGTGTMVGALPLSLNGSDRSVAVAPPGAEAETLA